MRFSRRLPFSVIRFCLLSSVLISGSLPVLARDTRNTLIAGDTSILEGRYDLTILTGDKPSPAWLEVRHSGLSTLVGRYVGSGGSARPISKLNFTAADGKLFFSIPPQWEKDSALLQVGGVLQGDSLSGVLIAPGGQQYSWKGVRAPSLVRTNEPVWGKPIKVFNGKDLSGWHALGNNQWKADSGFLRSPASGSNIATDQTFNDFKIHIEFRYPAGSNSGVYLRGRYEVQIEDSKGQEPLNDQLSGVYGFLSPTVMMAKNAGEWQTYDITLVGRIVSVSLNGKVVICNQEIPGITGGAINSREGEPGPIMLQGDHGPIDFRNVVITPAL